MSKLTKKQWIAQEEAYAHDMRETKTLDLAAAELQIVAEIESQTKDDRTRGGLFEDAFSGPLVVSDDCTRALASLRVSK